MVATVQKYWILDEERMKMLGWLVIDMQSFVTTPSRILRSRTRRSQKEGTEEQNSEILWENFESSARLTQRASQPELGLEGELEGRGDNKTNTCLAMTTDDILDY